MKRSILFIFAVITLSCGKKSDNVIAPDVLVNKATKIVVAKVTAINSTESSLSGPVPAVVESYIYDADNRIISSNGVPYTYDASGKLMVIGKEKTSTVTKYTYDANGVPKGATVKPPARFVY